MRRRNIFCTLAVIVLSLILLVIPAAADNVTGPGSGLSVNITARCTGSNEEVSEANDALARSYIRFNGKLLEDGAAADLNVTFMERVLLRLLLSFDSEKLSVALPNLDGNKYVISLEKLSSLLEQLSSGIMSGVTLPSGMAELPSSMPPVTEEEYMQAFGPYISLLTQSWTNKCEVSENITIELDQINMQSNGTIYAYAPTCQDLGALAYAVAALLENDQKVESIISRWTDYLSDIPYFLNSLAQALEMPYMSADMLKDQVMEAYHQIPDMLRELAGDLIEAGNEQDLSFQLTFASDQTGPIMAELFAGDEYESYRIGLQRYNGNTEDGAQKFAAAAFMEGDGVNYRIVLNNKLAYPNASGSLELQAYKTAVAALSYTLDLSHQSNIGIPYGTISISSPAPYGSLQAVWITAGDGEGNDNHNLVISGLDAATGDDMISGAIINIQTGRDGNPMLPEGNTVDLDTYDLEDLAALGNSIMQKLETILSQF